MTAHRAGSHAGVRSQLEFAVQQVLHAVLVHDEHYQVDGLSPNLQTEASTFNAEKCGSAPAFWSTAAGNAASKAGADDESSLEHGGDDRDTFSRSQNLFRNTLIGGGLDLLKHGAGGFNAVFSFVFVLVVIGSKGGNCETGDYAQNQKSFHFFLHFRELVDFVFSSVD